MTEFLTHFPAAWGLLGIVIASGAFLIANRYVFEMQRVATENLVRTLNDQIKAITTDRDDYKTKLDAEKNDHQATKLHVKELQTRPDITTLFQTSKDFYVSQTTMQNQQAAMMREQTALITQTIDAVHRHDKEVENKMVPLFESLKAIGEGIKELLGRSKPLPA